ncbi:hypothetical protein LCGC14_0908140 [marine sediment metagenome]|uniref:Uncharacterized protein n=1 Tax=marine sediment metagenome TaxID=412755 RepID=A0A0F9PF66_9ZZZZ
MPFTLVGWEESITPAGALTNITSLTDDHITETGDIIQVPSDLTKIGLASSYMLLNDRAQIRAPSMQEQVNLELTALELAAEPGSPQLIDNYFPQGIELEPGEQVEALIQAASGSVPGVILMWLFSTIDAIPPGKRFTIRFTAATAAVAYTWGSRGITLSERLRAGRYAVIGAKVMSDTMIAFRLIFTGQSNRPGALGVDAVDDIQAPVFRDGSLGVWGTFEHNELPRLEVLCVTTDSAFTGFLDLIKIA